MLKNIFFTVNFTFILMFSAFAQTTKTLVLPKPAPDTPPGNIQLIETYTHTRKKGIDTIVGEISKPGGLTIHYDNGPLAGLVAGRICGQDNCLWYKRQKVNENDVYLGFRADGFIVATFPKDYVNFYAHTKTQEEIADFLIMILTYKNSEKAFPNK